jgi:hypothetical protein
MTLLTMWLDVRDTAGKLLFRFDPQRDLVQVGERGRVVVVDLSQYRAQQDAKNKPVDIATKP